jgi:hypothetical protein
MHTEHDMTTARAVTGVTGAYLSRGFDRSDMFVESAGERIKVQEREVTFLGEFTVEEVLYSFGGKNERLFERFSLLATRVQSELNLPLNTIIGLYSSGAVREIRHGKKCYRAYGSTYYGKIN